MQLLRISLFLSLFAVALCAGKEGEEIIGNDSDLDNTDVTAEENVTGENVTVEKENVTKEKDVTKEQAEASPSRRFFDFLPRKHCVCISGTAGKKTVRETISRPGFQFERLVVYLYKSKNNHQIKIYVPNHARQIQFPDITYEEGDSLIDLNSGAKVLVAQQLGPAIRNFILIDERPIVKPDINFEIISNLDKNKIQSLLIYLRRFRETRTILNQLTGLTLLEKLKQLKLLFPQIYTKFLSKVTKFFPIWLNHGSIIRYRPNNLINFPYDINLIPAFQGKIIINGRPHYTINELIVYKPPNIDINVYYRDVISNNIQLNIDSWLNVILVHLNKQLQFVSKTLDTGALKSLLISILQKNGISITQNGYLVDVAGRSVSFTNIILRPILIGESRLVTRIINSGLFRIPSSIVFVEVVLVSGAQLKSLGIIPVGNIFVGLKKVEISTVVEIIETTVVCEGGRCQTVKKCKDLSGKEIVCSNAQSRSGNVIINSRDGVPTDFRSGNVIVNSRDAVPSDTRSGNVIINSRDGLISDGRSGNVIINSRGGTVPSAYVSGNDILVQSRSGDLSEARIGCPNCVQGCGGNQCRIQSVYDDSSDSSDSSDEGPYGRSGNVYVNENELNEEPGTRIVPGIPRSKQVYVVSEDVPGIRIVGGGAATGSGTPVSSKG